MFKEGIVYCIIVMATAAFYGMNERKIRNFYMNCIDLFSDKDVEDVSVDDILKYTGISRSTFYNYFSDIHELYNDFIEYGYKYFLEIVRSMVSNSNESLIDIASLMYKRFLEFFSQEKIFKIAYNFINSNDKIIRVVYNDFMDRYILDCVNFFMERTVEGRKINDVSKLYTLCNLISCHLKVSFESVIYKRIDKNLSVCLYDFELVLKILKAGVEKLYP